MAILKRNKDTKKKGGENTIGKIIYGFLLFMPLIAVGVACLYTIFNKNAYQSYSSDKVQNVSKVTSNDFLMTNNKFSINNMILSTTSGNLSTPRFTYSEININWHDTFGAPTNYNYDSFKFITGPNTTSNKFIYLYENGVQVWEDHTSNLDWFNTKLPITFTLQSYEGGTTGWYNSIDTSLITITQSKLDNVFYYQLEKLEDSDLFNWSKNTATYDVVHNTTTLLGISNTYTPILLTYWLIISVTYFVFDIALILVWAVHDKIHELKESI